PLDLPADLVEAELKPKLEAGDGFGVGRADGRLQRIVDAVELVDVGVGDVRSGRDGQLPGDCRLHPEDVRDVLAGQRQHDVAAVRLQLHHALATQFEQGL